MSQRLFLVVIGVLLLRAVSVMAADRPPPARLDRFGDPLPERALVRLGSVQRHVNHGIAGFAFWPNDHTLADCCWDGTVELWERSSGRSKCRLPTGLTQVRFAAFLPGTRRVALANGEDLLLLWDTAQGKEVWRARVPPRPPQKPPTNPSVLDGRVAASADGKLLAAGWGENKVQLFKASSGRMLRPLEGVTGTAEALAFSPDGSLLAVIQSTSQAGLWDVATGKKVRALAAPGSWDCTISFTPDGKQVALSSYGRMVVCAVATGKKTVSFQTENPDDNSITGVLFSADGKTLISTHSDGTLRFWDALTGKVMLQREFRSRQVCRPILSQDGKLLAVLRDGDSFFIELLDPRTGQSLLPAQENHSKAMRGVSYTPDGRTLLSRGDETLRSWDAATGKLRSCISLPEGESCALSADGKMLAQTEAEAVKLWDLAGGKVLRVLKYGKGEAILELAFSADGKQLLTVHNGCADPNRRHRTLGQHGLHVWDVATGKELRSTPRPTAGEEIFSALALTSDGRTAVVASKAGSVSRSSEGLQSGIYVMGGGHLYAWCPSTGRPARILRHDRITIHSLRLSSSGRLLVSSGLASIVRLWELPAGEMLFQISREHRYVNTADLSPDGRLVAISYRPDESAPGAARSIDLYSTVTRRPVLSLVGTSSQACSLTFSPDSRRLASGMLDGSGLVWDVAPAQQAVQQEIDNLRGRQPETLWADLASTDVSRGHQALWALVAEPALAVRLLKEHLQPVEEASAGQIRKLVEDLDADEYAAREAAMRALTRLGELAEPALTAHKDSPAPERQRRVRQLLAHIDKHESSPEGLRTVRAVEVLEQLATPAARQLLQDLAEGAPAARQTQSAKAALDRLSRRPVP